MYIDFVTYASMGGSANEAAFPRLEFLAEKKLDRYTQNRIRGMKRIPCSVQFCMVDLINALGVADHVETASAPVVSSFSNDGYSETYAAPVTSESIESGLYWIIADYLATETDDHGTPLMFLGVSG